MDPRRRPEPLEPLARRALDAADEALEALSDDALRAAYALALTRGAAPTALNFGEAFRKSRTPLTEDWADYNALAAWAGGAAGSQSTATEKIETGIILVVTPQVSSDGFVMLDMFAKSSQAVRKGSIGTVTNAWCGSPASLEKTHPDLFWYGIHGCETLFTAMGPGVQTVVRTSTKDFDQVTGTWKDGRIGTFRGIRSGSGGYGGTAFGTKGVASVGPYDGYKPLVVEIVKFYRTGTPPVTAEETLDIYAFMEAADESKRQGGKPVAVADVMTKAKAEADAKVKKILETK